MNRLCSPIATAVSLLAVSLPAQEQQAPRPVAARPQRVTLLPQGVEDARRAKMIALVEKLASGELTDAERAECKRALLEMMAGSRSAQPRKAVVVEVEEAGDDDAPVRWRVNTAKPVEERREVRVVRPAPVREWVQKSGEGDGEARVRYRMIEGGKGKGLVLRARDDEPSGDAPEAKQERRVFMFKERPNAEGLEARITKVLEEVGGALEIDVQVHDERDERDERRRRVVRRLRRDRDEEEGGHGHGEHEHGHDDDDHGHGHGHGHDDDHDEHHEHAVVEELFGMIEAMRDEMRGLREMVAELHRMLHEQRGADRGARGRFGRRR